MWKYRLLEYSHCCDITEGQGFILYESVAVRRYTIRYVRNGKCEGVTCYWNTKKSNNWYICDESDGGRGEFSPRYLGICSRCKYCGGIDGSIADKVIWL